MGIRLYPLSPRLPAEVVRLSFIHRFKCNCSNISLLEEFVDYISGFIRLGARARENGYSLKSKRVSFKYHRALNKNAVISHPSPARLRDSTSSALSVISGSGWRT